MEIQVIFSPVAAQEIRKSFEWYEKHLEGLGNRFVDIIDKTIQFILLNPEGYPEKHPPYREIVLERFPFILIYEYDKKAGIILVLRVFHTKRNPRFKYKKG